MPMPNMTQLVLTRPAKAAQSLLRDVVHDLGHEPKVILSPVIEIVPIGDWPVLPSGSEVILTSFNAVRGPLLGVHVHCVGQKTAEHARAQGATIVTLAPDAHRLLDQLRETSGDAQLLHLCGSHKAVDIAAHLREMGRTTQDLQVYAQVMQPLSAAAKKAIEGEEPTLLPLFSPRSARLTGQAIDRPGQGLRVIAISDAVAAAWTELMGGAVEIAPEPTGKAMVSRIVAALNA